MSRCAHSLPFPRYINIVKETQPPPNFKKDSKDRRDPTSVHAAAISVMASGIAYMQASTRHYYGAP
jgi:hypothetical protein